ncbi:MAG: sensor histidine kinase [Anaerolineae bacterium]
MSEDLVRGLPLFEGLSDADFERLLSMAEEVSVKAGHLLMREGEPGDSLYVVLDGELAVTKRAGEQDVMLNSCEAGDVIGEISLLEKAPRSASVRATTQGRLLKIGQPAFEQVLAASPSAALAILHTVMARLRNTEIMLHQSEKMAAMGKLAAGVAHELNNPAAAVRRAAEQLAETLQEWSEATSDLGALDLDPSQKEALSKLSGTPPGDPVRALDPLARGDLEDAVQGWLEARGVEDAWRLAPAIASAGWNEDRLSPMEEYFSKEQLAPIARWLAAGGSARALVQELATGSDRISGIVGAIKSYSHLDEAPIKNVDVHRGLEDTLVILRHKLDGVEVEREYSEDLPGIEAYASELNQVWTNIIDNAIDAMGGRGDLTLRTSAEDGRIVVEIEDTGPGISEEIRQRVFEPFFTTKPPGAGTGLGLHIAYNIVVHRHGGQIEVDSMPGGTRFRIKLPSRPPAEGDLGRSES